MPFLDTCHIASHSHRAQQSYHTLVDTKPSRDEKASGSLTYLMFNDNAELARIDEASETRSAARISLGMALIVRYLSLQSSPCRDEDQDANNVLIVRLRVAA